MHSTVVLYFSSKVCFSFTFQGTQTYDYFLIGEGHKGTQIQQSGSEAVPPKLQVVPQEDRQVIYFNCPVPIGDLSNLFWIIFIRYVCIILLWFGYISDTTGMVVLTEYDKVQSRRKDIGDSGEEEEEQKGGGRQGKETWLFIGTCRRYRISKIYLSKYTILQVGGVELYKWFVYWFHSSSLKSLFKNIYMISLFISG